MSVTLKIKGFNTMAEAQAFADWYEGQGEQDSSNWFECRKEEGEIDIDTIHVDVHKPYEYTEDEMTIYVNPM